MGVLIELLGMSPPWPQRAVVGSGRALGAKVQSAPSGLILGAARAFVGLGCTMSWAM
jgi:hypothetical protein